MVLRKLMVSVVMLSMPLMILGADDAQGRRPLPVHPLPRHPLDVEHRNQIVAVGGLADLLARINACHIRLDICKGILNKVEQIVAPESVCAADHCVKELRFLAVQTDDIQALIDAWPAHELLAVKMADFRGILDGAREWNENKLCEQQGNPYDCFKSSLELNSVYRAFCREYKDKLATNPMACQHAIKMLEARKPFVTKIAGKASAQYLVRRELGVHAPISSIKSMLVEEERRNDAFVAAMKDRNWAALPE